MSYQCVREVCVGNVCVEEGCLSSMCEEMVCRVECVGEGSLSSVEVGEG